MMTAHASAVHVSRRRRWPSSAASCGDVVRDGPVAGVPGHRSAARRSAAARRRATSGGTLLSDVLTNVTTPAPCTPTIAVPDGLQRHRAASRLRIAPKDIGTARHRRRRPNNEVTITRYRVIYRRADGRNTPGVDVPYRVRRRGDRDGAGRRGTLTLGVRARPARRQEGSAARAAGRRARRSSRRSRTSRSTAAIRSATTSASPARSRSTSATSGI